VPEIPASSSSAFFYLCHGNPSAADAQNPPAVWTAYDGVWHLSETSGSVARDSLGVADGQYVGSPALGQTGPMGDRAVTFGSGRAMDLGTAGLGGTSFTIEALVSVASCADGAPGRIFARAQPGATYAQHELQFGVMYGNPVFCKAAVGVRTDLGNAVSTSNDGFSKNTWVHLAVVFGGGSVRLYVNGKAQTEVSLAGELLNSPTARASWAASLLPAVTLPFDGTIAEARVSRMAASDGWIAAQNTAMRTSNFITIE
jgi:hypothetical protein